MNLFGFELNLLALELCVAIGLIFLYVIVNIISVLIQRGKNKFLSNIKQYIFWPDAAILLLTSFAIVPLIALLVYEAFGISIIPSPDKIEQSNLHISYALAVFFYIVIIYLIFTKSKFEGSEISDVRLREDSNATDTH